MEATEFICPDCGTTLKKGMAECPKCSNEFDWEDADLDSEETIDQILEEVTDKSAIASEDKDDAPEMDPSDEPPEASEEEVEDSAKEVEEEDEPEVAKKEMDDWVADEEPHVEKVGEPQDADEVLEYGKEDTLEVEEAEVEEEEEAEGEDEAEEEEEADEVDEIEVTRGPRLYAGGLSIVGLLFAVVSIGALIGTLVFLNWDTWITAASEESVGNRQQLFIYLGASGFVLSLVITTLDAGRHRKKGRK